MTAQANRAGRLEAAAARALTDPEYHRRIFLPDHCLPGESEPRLLAPQAETLRCIERAIEARNGRTVVVRSARQTMKNDVDATLIARVLQRYRLKGGTVIRSAPSFSPQLVTSRRRIEMLIAKDALFALSGPPRWRYGHILTLGAAEVVLVSGQPGGHQEGQTASLLLSIDEAHRFDQGVFEGRLAPMVAFGNVPTVMYGIAAGRDDMLFEYLRANMAMEGADDPDNPGGRVIELETVRQYPAEVWCDLLPAYRDHVDLRERRLGADHPTVLTNYHLVDVDSVGAYLSRTQQQHLLVSDHPRGKAPSGSREFVALVDLAGEVEEAGEHDLEYGDPDASADAFALLVFAVDRQASRFDWPRCQLVDIQWAVGLPHDGPDGIKERLERAMRRWRPRRMVIDARGVGYGVARWAAKKWTSRTIEYSATATTKSEDLYGFLAMANAGAVLGFRPDGSKEWLEWEREVKRTRRKISGHSLLDLVKPRRSDDGSVPRIDMVRAATYLPRAVASSGAAGHFLEAHIAKDDPYLSRRRGPEDIRRGTTLVGRKRDR